MEPIKLTQTVQKGGCAAKVAAEDLKKILKTLRFPQKHPELLVDGSYFDDAAIYQITPEIALVQTLDFFTPILDTPYLFGQVAATNALSDVYAMGGLPKTAMAILAVPMSVLSDQHIGELLQGACDKIQEAGANLVGGHSIDDDTLKFGLSVTGLVHPKAVWSNNQARPGDRLLLTKALGTGALCAGLKQNHFTEDDISEAIESMTTLNNIMKDIDSELLSHIHSATDITGFGLSGHAQQMALASDVTLEIQFSQIPHFKKFFESLEKGHRTKAHRTNAQYTAAHLQHSSLSEYEELLLHDPQTSGGLLLSVAPSVAKRILEKLKARYPFAADIGRVCPKRGPRVEILS